MSKDKFTAVSIFSGAMGLDIGIESTGQFEVLAAVEIEPTYCETIRVNRDKGLLANRHLKIYNADITKLDPYVVMDELGLAPGELDLLLGGPPCQSFSTAGRRGTIQDPRGTLLWQFLRYVEAFRPKFFLMENVRGLVSAAIRHRPIKERPERGGPPLAPDEQPGSVLRLFADDLARIPDTPYRMDCFEVNAVNYGAPQLRERLLCIGNRFNQLVDFPNPTHGPVEDGVQTNVNQLSLFGDPVSSHTPDSVAMSPTGKLLPYRTLGDAIRGLREENPVIMDFSPRKKKYLAMVPPGGNWRSLPLHVQKESMGRAWYAKGGRSGWWRRLSYDLPCPTIVTMPNHASTSLCHPEEVRALTVRECALVQEFPIDWEFVGTPFEQYAQVGNAVPIRLGAVAGQVIAQHLKHLLQNEFQVSSEAVPRFRLVYVQSHVRTRRWYNKGQTFVWKDGRDNRDAMHQRPVTLRKVRFL